MEISPGDNIALRILRVCNEYQRIIDCGVHLGIEYTAAMRQRVANGAVHLWNASEGVGVLHAATLAVRLPDLAALEHASQIRRGKHLPTVWASFMNALVESSVGAF